MYGGRRGPLHLKPRPLRQKWICQRCFHAQWRLHGAQQLDPSSGSPKSSEKPLSPVEAFRLKYIQQRQQNETPKQPLSPAERFRTNWSLAGVDKQPEESVSEKDEIVTLADLAAAYRKHGSSKKYAKIAAVKTPNQKGEIKEAELEEMERASRLNDMNELNELDDMEEVTESGEVFAGENMRDYQGVLPLNGEQYTPQKFPIKQGDLIETRGYLKKTLIV